MLICCVVTLFVNQVMAQNGSQPKVNSTSGVQTKQLSKKTITTADLVINKLTAKTYKKIDIINPKTGAPTSEDTVFNYTITNRGKEQKVSIKAKDYYEQINKIEKGLNELGYSLRDVTSSSNNTQSTIKLQSSKIDQNVLTTQITNAPKSIGTKSSATTISSKFGTKSTKLTTNTVKVGSLGAVANASKSKEINRSETKKWEFGNKSSFEAFLEVQLKTSGKFFPTEKQGEVSANDECKMEVTGTGGGYIFHEEFDVIQAKAQFQLPPDNGDLKADISVDVLGVTVYDLEETQKVSWSKEKDYHKDLKVSAPFYVPLGPFNISGEVGMKGSAGVKYDVLLNRSGVTGSVTPYVKVSGYAEAGLDILVASAGIGGSLTVCDAEVPLSASAIVAWQGSKLSLIDEFSIDYDVTFLSGRLYLYAEVKNPFGKDPRYEYDLFNWSGYKSSGNIVNISNSTQLN